MIYFGCVCVDLMGSKNLFSLKEIKSEVCCNLKDMVAMSCVI
jgi:hypothetical protein